MANNYNPGVNFSDDEVGSTDKLNQIVLNVDTVYNLLPHFLNRQGESSVRDFNTAQANVLKPTIFTGRVKFNLGRKYGRSRNIYFPPGTFAPACQPSIQTTIAGTGHERYVTVTIASTTGGLNVTNEGFKVQVYHRDGEKFQSDVSVHYVAFGWQEA